VGAVVLVVVSVNVAHLNQIELGVGASLRCVRVKVIVAAPEKYFATNVRQRMTFALPSLP